MAKKTKQHLDAAISAPEATIPAPTAGVVDFATLSAQVTRLAAQLGKMEGQLERLGRLAADVRNLVGPVGIPMPDGQMLVQTVYGVKFLIDPSDLIMAPNLIIYRQWEPDISSFFWSSFDANTVFVDVGANLGYFTCLGASRIGRSGRGRVFAVEPNPNCLKLLDRNLIINWSMSPVDVFRGAVGDHEARAVLAVPRNRAANASISVGAERPDDTELVDVALKPLDTILPNDLVVDFMKIDVEGHEFAALSGATSVLRRSPNIKIVMEWSPRQMSDAGYPATQMVELLRGLGLRAFRMGDAAALAAGTATPLEWFAMTDLGYDNLILTY